MLFCILFIEVITKSGKYWPKMEVLIDKYNLLEYAQAFTEYALATDVLLDLIPMKYFYFINLCYYIYVYIRILLYYYIYILIY
jgi:hypothetical protein